MLGLRYRPSFLKDIDQLFVYCRYVVNKMSVDVFQKEGCYNILIMNRYGAYKIYDQINLT